MSEPTPEQMMLHMALTQQAQAKGDKSFVLYSIASNLLIGWPDIPVSVKEWAMTVCAKEEAEGSEDPQP